MTINGQSLTYGQSYVDQGGGVYTLNGFTEDLFWPTAGMVVRVDNEFTAEAEVSDFPSYFLVPQYRPDSGLVLSLSLIFRPVL
jgi:hypothetical protein